MKASTILSIGMVLAVAFANCENQCSGHGTCGANDACTCYPNYMGLDCSERVCAYQIAFADVASADNVAHAYAECSGKGICDRKSGLCKCFAGYDGEACRRTVCPNDCSGHGTCELMDEIAADGSMAAGGAAGRVLTSWEAKKNQVCKCDPYWSGIDCNMRECPKGDDPLTTGGVAEVQTITVTDGEGSNTLEGRFTLTYTDKFNGVWTTRPIRAYEGATVTGATAEQAAAEMASALNGLPNQVIDGIQVTAAVANTNDGEYTVTFNNTFNPGNQNPLVCNIAGCTVNGCEPYFLGVTSGGGTPSCAVAETTAGTKEVTTCSNRGACDYATGLCVCHNGYTGEACSTQTNFA